MASGTVGSLLIEMALDLARLRSTSEEAKRTFSNTVKDMEATAKKGLAAIGVSLSGAAFVGVIKGAVDAADELGKLSEKTGIAVDALSGMKLAAELGNVGFEQFSQGLKAFNNSLVEAQNGSSKASKLFKALGVDINAGPKEAFRQFADAIAILPAGELKTAAATEILKKAGQDWIPVLNQGSSGLDEMQRKAERLGFAVGPEFARQAQEFNDNMRLLQKGSTAFGMAIAKDILPPLIEMTNNMLKARESGSGLLGVLKEIGKLGLATAASISNMGFGSGLLGYGLDRAAEAAFGTSGTGTQETKGKIKGLGSGSLGSGAGFKSGYTKDEIDKITAALANNDAEQKRYIGALQSLESEYARLTREGRLAITMWETEKGSLRDLTPAHKKELLEKAALIDAYKRDADQRAMVLAGIEAESQARNRNSDIVADSLTAHREEREQLVFETSQIGLTARELEKSNALRVIDLRLRQQVAAIPMDEEGNYIGNGGDTLNRLRAEAEAQKAVVLGLIDARQLGERDAVTASRQFLRQYVEDTTDAARNSRDAWTSTFQSAEDAMTQWARTGKLEARDLASTIIAELFRIYVVRRSLGAIAGGIDSFFGSSSLNAGGPTSADGLSGGTFATGTDYVPREGLYRLHRGEAVVNAAENRGGGNNYFIDATGQDAGVVARLERALLTLAGPGVVEHRAVSAVVKASRRGLRMR